MIDSASTDDTLSIVNSNSHNIAHFISEKDKGVYDAWNKAIPYIKGEWVIFLGSDDYFYNSNVLESVSHDLYKAYPSHNIVYGKILMVNKQQDIIGESGKPWSIQSHEYDLPAICFPPHPATFHHRSLFENNKFDDSYKYAADLLFVRKAIKDVDPLFIDQFITCFSMGGLTSNNKKLIDKWIERNQVAQYLDIKIKLLVLVKSFIKVVIESFITTVFGNNFYTYMVKKLFRPFRQIKV